MIAAPVLSAVVGVWQSYLTNAVGQRVLRDLRTALYTHLQTLVAALLHRDPDRRHPEPPGQRRRRPAVGHHRYGEHDPVQHRDADQHADRDAGAVVAAHRPVVVPDSPVRLADRTGRQDPSAAVRRDAGRPVGHDRPDRGNPFRIRVLCCRRCSVGRTARPRGTWPRTNGWPRWPFASSWSAAAFFAVVSTFFSITPVFVYLLAGWELSRGATRAHRRHDHRRHHVAGPAVPADRADADHGHRGVGFGGPVPPGVRLPRPGPRHQGRARRARACRSSRSAARSSCATSGSPTKPSGPTTRRCRGRCAGSTCPCARASWRRWSGPAEPARRRSATWCRGSTTRPAARSAWTAPICASSPRPAWPPRSAWSPRRATCSTPRSATTSPTPARTPPRTRSNRRPAPRTSTTAS